MARREPTGARRMGCLGFAVFAVGVACLGGAAAAQQQQQHCQSDALEEWWCAESPQGSAVHDNLGRVVCAPGACVMHEDEWICSWRPGGTAGASPEGPVCDGECRPPTTAECTKM